MSKEQVLAFFEEIAKNKKLAQEVEKVVGEKSSDEEKAEELISLAKKHGFIFTKAEAASVKGLLKKSLSPEEMLEVSGGKGGLKSSLMAMALLAGLGVGGAAMSSRETSAMDGDNRQEIQVPGGQAGAGRQEGNAQPGQQQQGAEGNQEQPGQQNAAAQAEQQQQWVFDGRRTVDAGHFIEVQGPGGLLSTGDGGMVRVEGDREVQVTGSGRGVLVDGDREVLVTGSGQKEVFVDGDREVQVTGSGRGVLVAGDRAVQVDGPGQQVVAVRGDREVQVAGPGQRGVFVNGDREVQVHGPGQRGVLVAGDRAVQVNGAGATLINRPGGRAAGELPEICAAPPRLLNPNRGPQEAPVYAPRDVFLTEVGTATINGAQQAYINCPCDVTHSAPGGKLRVTGNTMILTEGNNHITAGRGSHVISFSVNELNHEGDGAVNIDRGDIVVSSTTMNDILGRNVTIENANAVTVNGAVSLAVTAVGDGGIDISSDATVTHSAEFGRINVTGGATINAEGSSEINAHEGTTIISTSANRLLHSGTGSGVIDRGNIEFSGYTKDGLTRNVLVRNANNVLVAPGISTLILDGTTFPMGKTREETLNNILDTIPEPTLSEQNTTTLTDRLTAIAREYGLSGESLFAFLRKHVFRGG